MFGQKSGKTYPEEFEKKWFIITADVSPIPIKVTAMTYVFGKSIADIKEKVYQDGYNAVLGLNAVPYLKKDMLCTNNYETAYRYFGTAIKYGFAISVQ